MPTRLNAPSEDGGTPSRGRSLRRQAPLATAAAAIAMVAIVASVSAGPGLGLTEVTAQPRAAGVASPNFLSPELVEYVVAQGSWVLENPSADGVIRYYGYLSDGNPLAPITAPLAEAQKTEPDKNTYVILKGLHGADAAYAYGDHFLYQGHEIGPRGYITRINLDADPSHRVTLLASTDTNGANLPVFDGSVWNPFTQTLLFSWEGNGTTGGGFWESTPDVNATVIDRTGILGRGGFEGIQADSDGNLWIVEDIGGKTGTAGGAQTNNAKQPNSFVYRFVPNDRTNLGAGGKLQVLQADGKNGQPVTFTGGAAPTQAQIDADVTSAFMKDLHAYGNSFTTRWITIHDTAIDGTTSFNANLLAKTKGGTPFKRPENGQFRPGTKFGEFYFTETGDTNATSGANGPSGASLGGWGGILRLSQKDPSASTGTLSPLYLGDIAHTGFDNLAFLSRDDLAIVEDAGDTLHGQRNALDSGYILHIDPKGAAPTPFRFLGEGRDLAATIDAANGGFGKNDGDNEITGIHVSDGDASVKGLIGKKEPQFLGGPGTDKGEGRDSWRFFWTQQHGDNATYEVISAPH